MKTALKRVAPAFIGALLLLITLAAPLYLAGNIRAAPLGAGPVQVFNLNSAAVSTSTTWSGGRWSALGTEQPPTEAEVWLSVDVTTVNTASFGLQVSPDNTTWLDHSTAGTLAANVVADANQYTALTIRGVYYRVVMTASNNNTLTPTIKVVLR